MSELEPWTRMSSILELEEDAEDAIEAMAGSGWAFLVLIAFLNGNPKGMSDLPENVQRIAQVVKTEGEAVVNSKAVVKSASVIKKANTAVQVQKQTAQAMSFRGVPRVDAIMMIQVILQMQQSQVNVYKMQELVEKDYKKRNKLRCYFAPETKRSYMGIFDYKKTIDLLETELSSAAQVYEQAINRAIKTQKSRDILLAQAERFITECFELVTSEYRDGGWLSGKGSAIDHSNKSNRPTQVVFTRGKIS